MIGQDVKRPLRNEPIWEWPLEEWLQYMEAFACKNGYYVLTGKERLRATNLMRAGFWFMVNSMGSIQLNPAITLELTKEIRSCVADRVAQRLK